MINTVRNTVLSVLNKNNYGYLSPSDFNLFSKQAQLDIFESYFYQYNYQINKENVRQSGTGVANVTKSIEESIDLFSLTRGLNTTSSIAGSYFMPSEGTTGSDYYFLNKLLAYKEIITSGTTTAFDAANNLLIDSAQAFDTLGIVSGDVVGVQTATQGVQYLTIVSVTDATTILTSGTVLIAAGFAYSIIKAGTQQNEIEKVTHTKINMLNNSIYTSPSATYPSYTSEEATLQVYPNTISTAGRIIAQYYRYPKSPNWTYIELANGEPIFNQSDAQYQDFEIPLDDENNLIMKILQYAGVSIREPEVFSFANSEEGKENQQEG
tara:strand:- start:143 stop:1111 length:969 start_codon:yes stop_codon:yes gene_type:complete